MDFASTALPTIVGNALGAKNGVFTFDVPHIDPGNEKVIDIAVCTLSLDPDICDPTEVTSATTQCVANVGVPTLPDPITHTPHTMVLHLDAVTPNAIVISGTVPLEVLDTPVKATVSGCLLNLSPTMHIGYGTPNPSDSGCKDQSVPDVSPYDLPITVTIPLVAETLAPRQGFTKIDVGNAVIDLSGIQQQQVQICVDCGGFGTACDDLTGSNCCDSITNSSTVKNLIVSQLTSTLGNDIKPLLQSELCQKPDTTVTPSCPTGTQPSSDGSACVFTSNTGQCVSTLLGTETHLELGSLLGSISPGTQGALDILLASGGAMTPYPNKAADNIGYKGHTPNGITLGLLGGALPQPQSECVPKAVATIPTDIPTPKLLEGDTAPPGWPTGTTGPDLDVAIAARFLNYALANIYNSGLLCLGITTEQVSELNSGLISVLIPSVKNLTFEEKAAGVAITTRPQMPPTVKLGGGTDKNKDPLMMVTIPKFALDFYVWSDDRYVRALTFEADLSLPVSLQTGVDPKTNPNGGIIPVLGTIGVANGVVTNSELLIEDPTVMAGALTSIISGAASQFLGNGFSPINVSSALSSFGLALQIPANGIQKITEGSDDFLTLFANLQNATPAIATNTTLQIKGKNIDPQALSVQNYDRSKLPSLDIEMGSPEDGAFNPVEYSWAIDNGTRSLWSTDKVVTIQTDYLFYQGKHTLKAWSRFVGKPMSEDQTPATAPFVIDVLPPEIQLNAVSSKAFTIDALDFVSDKSELKARVSSDGGKTFGAWATLDPTVQYPSNGVTVVQVSDGEGNIGEVSQDLIRGREDVAAAASSCGCSTPGSDATSSSGIAIIALIGGLAAIMLRRRKSKHWAIVGIGTIGAVASTTQGCACGDSDAQGSTGCGGDCNQVCGPALPLGLAGAYLSVTKAPDGSYWASGYNDAALTSDFKGLYGDLIVGKYDAGKQLVAWASVDGLPPARTDGTCPDNDPTGWRGGETDSGDDVGLWTSIQMSSAGQPMVSYYDATHSALKFATYDGTNWTTYTIMQAANSDIGRYSKMLVVNGNPVVAFLIMEPGTDGALRSRVTIATSSVPTPNDPSKWTFSDALVDDKEPCTATTCAANSVCLTTGACSPTVAGCTPACASPQACVTVSAKPACTDTIDSSTITTYPNAFGDYISMAQEANGSLGIVVYNRILGNLVALEQNGSAWKQTVLDGQAVSQSDTGIGASLAITADGTWHVSYVSGLDETLRYVEYSNGTAKKFEIADTGYGADGTTYPDGQHIIGDDSNIQVDSSGTVTISYQDATAGNLLRATGTLSGTTHKWSVHAYNQSPKFAGFFANSLDAFIANFWRQADPTTGDTVGDVAFVTP